MKIIFFISVFLLWNATVSQNISGINSCQKFPESWIGYYKGTLKIYAVDSVAVKIPMELLINQKNDSTYQWKITYIFKGQKDIRDYDLKTINKQKGLYRIDEKNSITLDATYRKETLTSLFKVIKNYILASYYKQGETIIFEIVSASDNNSKITGNRQINGDTIPKVTSYMVSGRQKAILLKTTKNE